MKNNSRNDQNGWVFFGQIVEFSNIHLSLQIESFPRTSACPSFIFCFAKCFYYIKKIIYAVHLYDVYYRDSCNSSKLTDGLSEMKKGKKEFN